MNGGTSVDKFQGQVADRNKKREKLLSDTEKMQRDIAETSNTIKTLETKNQENTKQLIDKLKAQIQANETQLKANEEEIARLNKVISETSAKLASFGKEVKAQATPWFFSKAQNDKTPKTPTQTSSDSSSNQVPKDPSQPSTAQQPSLSTETSTQKNSENEVNQVPTDSSQSSNEKQEDNAQNLTPKSASQVASDGQNNPQEQAPQIAPVDQSENPQASDTQRQTPQAPEASTPAPQAESQQTPQKIETQPELTEDQKLTQVRQIFDNLSVKFANLQAESNSITLTAAELASLDQASNLLQQDSISQSTADQRALLINDEDARKDYIKELKEQIKAEKKASKDLKKIRDLQEKLAQVSNHNNYNLNVMNSLSGINSVLQNGTYLDTKFQIPREQKFALELIKKRDLLRSWAVVPLTIDGRTVEVYNGAFVGQALQTWLRIDNCNQPVNIVEKLLVDHTKMSLDQARSATKTITTIGVLAGAFYGLKWLLGNTDKEGNRSFGLSPKKFLGAAVVLLGGNMASQMATGRGALDLINEFWRTGNNPFTSETYEKAQPIEQISLDQTALQMALLGVPYAQLSQFTSPKSWPISSIDLASLQRYYEAQMLIAKQNQLNDKIQQIGAQISAIKDIINNPNATQLLNQNLANMNIQAQELANPENAGLTLDDLLYQNSNNRKILETYMETNNLMIAPGKKKELMSKIIAKWTVLTDPIMVSLKDDGLLIPNIPENAEIAKLNLTPDQKQALEEAFRNLSKKSEFKNIQLSALSDQEIMLKSDSGEIVLNAKTLTIPGLVNSAGQELQMQNHEELLHIGLFINQTKAKFWNEIPDRTKKQDKDGRPFAQPHGRNNFTAWQGIIFKGALSTKEVLTSTIPSWDEMNKYPTIEKGDGRDFLINYLNTQWKKDNPSKYNPTASEKK